jgi:hypothetical protein
MTVYVPDHVTQRTGSPCQFSLCWGAVGAWLAGGATGGTVKLTPEEFARRAGGGSGAPNPATGCKTGFESDLMRGLNILGIDNDDITIPFPVLRQRLKNPRRAIFGVAVDYELWPVDKDCMNGTADDVNHMVGLIPGIDPKGRIRVMNPLCTDYQLVHIEDVQRAAAAFSRKRRRKGILVIRVDRPKEQGLPADKERIADLEELVEAQADWIAGARMALQEALDVPVPTGGKR